MCLAPFATLWPIVGAGRTALTAALVGACCLGSMPVWADTVLCHVTYGGETRQFSAQPDTRPYRAAAQPVGSFFLFRVVFEAGVAIKTYVYADREAEGALPLYQSSHAWPVSNAARHGFSGLNFVYEPLRDGELEFWCELR